MAQNNSVAAVLSWEDVKNIRFADVFADDEDESFDVPPPLPPAAMSWEDMRHMTFEDEDEIFEASLDKAMSRDERSTLVEPQWAEDGEEEIEGPEEGSEQQELAPCEPEKGAGQVWSPLPFIIDRDGEPCHGYRVAEDLHKLPVPSYRERLDAIYDGIRPRSPLRFLLLSADWEDPKPDLGPWLAEEEEESSEEGEDEEEGEDGVGWETDASSLAATEPEPELMKEPEPVPAPEEEAAAAGVASGPEPVPTTEPEPEERPAPELEPVPEPWQSDEGSEEKHAAADASAAGAAEDAVDDLSLPTAAADLPSLPPAATISPLSAALLLSAAKALDAPTALPSVAISLLPAPVTALRQRRGLMTRLGHFLKSRLEEIKEWCWTRVLAKLSPSL